MKQRILSIFAALFLIVGSAMAQGLWTPELSVVLKEIKAGENTMLRFNIMGLDRMSSMQFNLSLPEGFELDGDIILRDATTDHTLYTNTLASGDLFVVLYSLDQNTFSNGYILNVPVAVAENAVSSEARIYNIRTATVKAVSNTLSDVTFALDVTAVEPEPDILVSNISLDQTAATLTEGETLTLTATVSPDDATNKTVTWSTSDASVATVDNNGVVTAVAAGTATITATAGDYSATCVVTVESNVVDGIDNSEIINLKSEIIYDLTGRRVTHPAKGVYIVNGKKVVIK